MGPAKYSCSGCGRDVEHMEQELAQYRRAAKLLKQFVNCNCPEIYCDKHYGSGMDALPALSGRSKRWLSEKQTPWHRGFKFCVQLWQDCAAEDKAKISRELTETVDKLMLEFIEKAEAALSELHGNQKTG